MELTFGQTSLQSAPTSCADIGLRASEKGDFHFARQMLHVAIEQLHGQDKQSRLIELIADIADTYLHEENYDMAEIWYKKALNRLELSQQAETLQAACLMARLAQVHALTPRKSELTKYLDNLLRIYLLDSEANISILLGPLVDLSWTLCVSGFIAEVHTVNDLIAQVKQLSEEEKFAQIVA